MPILKSWLRYRKESATKHGVHSPFVFDLVTKVFPGKNADELASHAAEDWRTECMLSKREINFTDLGTGESGAKKIAQIAKRSAKRPKQGQLLFRIINHFQPKKMLELGTSLGITTMYEASAVEFEKFISLEGSDEAVAEAKKGFAKYEITQPEFRAGAFEKNLLPALQELKSVDYVFFDGNHREEPTLNYFETCLPFAHKDSIFIFDDIHWSEEMESAWEKIKSHPKVKLTIDVFHFGIVFFREEQKEKEHFILRW
jgi:predicted O-methyltransferase YrrM